VRLTADRARAGGRHGLRGDPAALVVVENRRPALVVDPHQAAALGVRAGVRGGGAGRVVVDEAGDRCGGGGVVSDRGRAAGEVVRAEDPGAAGAGLDEVAGRVEHEYLGDLGPDDPQRTAEHVALETHGGSEGVDVLDEVALDVVMVCRGDRVATGDLVDPIDPARGAYVAPGEGACVRCTRVGARLLCVAFLDHPGQIGDRGQASVGLPGWTAPARERRSAAPRGAHRTPAACRPAPVARKGRYDRTVSPRVP